SGCCARSSISRSLLKATRGWSTGTPRRASGAPRRRRRQTCSSSGSPPPRACASCGNSAGTGTASRSSSSTNDPEGSMKSRQARLRLGLALLATLATVACGSGDRRGGRLVIASTTSTEDSGLFDVLIPAFEAAHPGVDAVVVAVGSGEALELGRQGDADVLLVHSPAAESVFVAEEHGFDRQPVMYNDFVIVGPAADPAGIRGLDDAVRALGRIAAAQATFVSRGDQSGTHMRELALWRGAGIQPAGSRRSEEHTSERQS